MRRVVAGVLAGAAVAMLWAGLGAGLARAAEERGGEREPGDERPLDLHRRLAEMQERLERVRQEASERFERFQDELRRETKARETAEIELKPLGKTVRIEFSVRPENGSNVVVLCASQTFAVSADGRTEGGGSHFEATGRLQPVEKDDNSLLVGYAVVAHSDGRAQMTHFEVRGSVQLKLGQSCAIAQTGDTILSLSVHLAE